MTIAHSLFTEDISILTPAGSPTQSSNSAKLETQLAYMCGAVSKTTADSEDGLVGVDEFDNGEFGEYGLEVILYMEELETRTQPSPYCMDQQTHYSWECRTELINWLIEVHSYYDLEPETLFLTVNYLDRYCTVGVIPKDHMQTLGIACLWLAAKYEENHGRVPSLKSLTRLGGGAYNEKQIVELERAVLKILDFDLGHPTTESFRRFFCKKLNVRDSKKWWLSRYLLELVLNQQRYLFYRPSVVALASVHLADMMITELPKVIKNSSVVQCMRFMVRQASKPSVSLQEKFGHKKFLGVCSYAQEWVKKWVLFLSF